MLRQGCFHFAVQGNKYSHVTRLIRDRLQWLPVAQRIQFKLCLMMYKAMHGLALYIYPSSAQVPALKVELGRLLAATL